MRETKCLVNVLFTCTGMDLERGQISKNPGPKTTTKLMLNSFWGKFRESLNKTKVSQMTEAFELLSIIANPLKDVRGYRFYL